MTAFGYFLSSEEHDGTTLVRTAQQAEEVGFDRVWISDHYHPWLDSQGQSPFVWCVIGGIASTTDLRVGTAVTCPTFRIHPAVVAQAAATAAAMLPGRFTLGVGTGEALNEHILGERWPLAGERLDRLAEAIELMRALWQGDRVDWEGDYFTVAGARVYTLPREPIPVQISAFGSRAMELVLSHGDGWITTQPDHELLAQFRTKGSGLASGSVKVCWSPDEAEARRLAHRLWPTEALPGAQHQELPLPAHFEQAVSKVTEDEIAQLTACGPDPERHLAAIRPFVEAGFDEVYVSQIGPDQEGFLRFWRDELRPRLGA